MEVPELLRMEFESRSWLQADFARVLNWPVQTVSELRQGKRRIDADMAVDLETLTERTAEEWLAAQARDDLEQARRKSSVSARSEQIQTRARVEGLVPVRELMRRGVITSKDPQVQAQEVAELLGSDPTSGASAKRTENATRFTRAQTAWIALARREAAARKVASYDLPSFTEFAASLPRRVTSGQVPWSGVTVS